MCSLELLWVVWHLWCVQGYGGLLCEGVLKRLPTLPSQVRAVLN